MVGSITPLGMMPNLSATQQNTQQKTQAPTEAQFSQWLTQKGVKPNTLNSQQRKNYFDQMQTEMQTQGIYANFGTSSASSFNTNNLVSATNNPISTASQVGSIGNLTNGVNPSMFGLSKPAQNIIATMMRQVAQAGIASGETSALYQKLMTNPNWSGIAANPLFQEVVAGNKQYLDIGAQQNAYLARQQQQQLQAQVAEEKAKKSKKTDA